MAFEDLEGSGSADPALSLRLAEGEFALRLKVTLLPIIPLSLHSQAIARLHLAL